MELPQDVYNTLSLEQIGEILHHRTEPFSKFDSTRSDFEKTAYLRRLHRMVRIGIARHDYWRRMCQFALLDIGETYPVSGDNILFSREPDPADVVCEDDRHVSFWPSLRRALKPKTFWVLYCRFELGMDLVDVGRVVSAMGWPMKTSTAFNYCNRGLDDLRQALREKSRVSAVLLAHAHPDDHERIEDLPAPKVRKKRGRQNRPTLTLERAR